MFHLYQHHDLTTLAELLAALRSRAGAGAPLVPDTVLVPNRGTARWLQAELAEAEGAAANLELPVPGRFAWQVLRDTLPGSPDSAEYERGALVWHLYALLPSVNVAAVQRYVAAEPAERHRYQLAVRLADVFDAYLIHRRDVLAQWEAGREERFPPASWQAPVWRALVRRLSEGFGVRHRAALLTEFLERAEDGTLDASAVPDPIYAFALVDLPADYLRLLHALGRYVDVHFLLPNPSAAYWGDVRRMPVAGPRDDGASGDPGFRFASSGLQGAGHEQGSAAGRGHPLASRGEEARGEGAAAGHPLLASLGRAGRDFLRVLYADEFDHVVEPDLGDALAYAPPAGDTLLARVQAGLVAGEAPVEDRGMAEGDASIQVHACHGPLREMQVLHDRLLDLLAREPELEPRGILVLLPDVAAFAPAVHSVFGAATGQRWIPYSIADRPRLDSHPIARTFQQLVELPLSRWTASEVLALAGVPAVMRRFGLDDADLALLHEWVPAAGVRWGLDAETRAAVGAAAFEQNTWRFGLDRLLLGLAQRDEGALVDGVAPWGDLEGGSAAAAGRLWWLVDRLRHWRDALAEAADAATWQERLNALAGELFAVDPDDAAEVAARDTVFEAIAALEGAARSLGDEPLSWEAVREALLGALAGPAERQPLVTGGVTFAGTEPLRGVPFDVICLVGMDDGAFPRQDGSREFSLIERQPRVGDPSPRDADRMLFLQALAGARRCFYVSYTGRSVADGSALQPSPVVGELLDYLHGHHFAGRSRAECRAALVTEQPMHPFSERYFAPAEPGLFTFVDDWRRAAEAQRAEREPAAAFVDDTRLDEPAADAPVDLADLQRFFRHPPQWFFRERLRLELDEAEDPLDDDEPRQLGGLGRHLLRQRMFERAAAAGLEAVTDEPDALERARGELPPPPLGGAEFAEAAGDVNALLPIHHRWTADAADARDVDIDLVLDDGTRVVGRVAGVAPGELRRLRPGRLRLAHRLPHWLDYLALAASGHEIGLQLAGARDGAAERYAAEVPPGEARGLLAAAVAHYREGHARPLPFEPYAAEHYLDQLAKRSQATRQPKTPDEALYTTNGWLANGWQPPVPMQNEHLRAVLDAGNEPLGASAADSLFVRLVDDVAKPMYTHLVEAGGEA